MDAEWGEREEWRGVGLEDGWGRVKGLVDQIMLDAEICEVAS